MVSRMTVGAVCGDQIDVTEKEREHDVSEEERVHRLSVGLLFAATLPYCRGSGKAQTEKKGLSAQAILWCGFLNLKSNKTVKISTI